MPIPEDNVGEFADHRHGALGAGATESTSIKYDDYANITIESFTMTDVGSSDRDGAVADGHQNGGAIVAAARDDAPSYNGDPATLINAVIRNGSIDGTSTGIELGEPGKQNATPDLLVETSRSPTPRRPAARRDRQPVGRDDDGRRHGRQ